MCPLPSETQSRPQPARRPSKKRRILLFLVLFLVLLLLPQAFIALRCQGRIYSRSDIPQLPSKTWALVLGSSVTPQGVGEEVRARLDLALDLYKAGKVKKILCTGDHQHENYDEPGAMARYLQERGVAQEDIVQDRYGLRSFDSIWRARQLYKVKDAYLCSQSYHCPRLLILADSQGLDCLAIGAHSTSTYLVLRNALREFASRYLALWQGYIWPSLPAYTEV